MYQPSSDVLDKYADVLVNFALNHGEGIEKDDVVMVSYKSPAKPLTYAVQKAILKAGGHPLIRHRDEQLLKDFLDLASPGQLEFFPKEYKKAEIDTLDHYIAIRGQEDPFILQDVKPQKFTRYRKKAKHIRKWQFKKENKGEFSWTLCLYPTEGIADQANLSLEVYWEQVIKACFLDKEDPIKKWREVFDDMHQVINKLNNLPVDKLHVTSNATDLWITLGDKRKFIGGRGANIPSFEIYTSPDWRGTEGTIRFDMPLYRYGNLVEGITLRFEEGKVVEANAESNERFLHALLEQENADKIGEFSLTDKRFSRIDKFMAEGLYDENYGGEWGNSHIALGTSYHDTYDGDPKNLDDEDWEKLGFNESPEHSDLISTENRTVEAILKNGDSQVIYKDGKFTFI